jgi:parallel beta-helix repeat protein
MATKRHIPGGVSRWALIAYVLMLLCGVAVPPVVPVYAASLPRPVARPLQVRTTVAVTTTSDRVDGNTASFDTLLAQPGSDGAVSLREALLAAHTSTVTDTLTIGFNIPTTDSGYSAPNGIWTITLGTRALPVLARGNLTIDGRSQPGTSTYPRIVLDGMAVYEAAGFSNGFTLTSPNNIIRGMTLMNFYDDAILLDGANAAANQILGCYIGTGPNGRPAPSADYFGIELRNGAHDNVIGGAGADARNLIGGAEHSGILITGAATQGNLVANNWIGVDSSGQAALPNKVAGVMISAGAHNNTIGGAGQGNIISGNGVGVYLDGATDATVVGNTIGLAADSTTPLGNASGGIFAVRGAQNNQIGGTTAPLRNLISGNGVAGTAFGQGIYISDANSTGNAILGNYIGTDSSGIAPAGNYRQGILIAVGAQHNQVGDTVAGAGNVVAYNGLGGIRIDSPYNRVQGNLVGVGADARTQLGNQANGIRIGGSNNTIGPNNIISNNQHSGLLLLGSYGVVQGNTFERNGRSGMCVLGSNATIDRNTIIGNGNSAGPWPECAIRGGIVITDTNDVLVTSNTITQNNDGGVAIYRGNSNRILANSISSNQGGGIRLLSGANDNLVPPVLKSAASDMVQGSSCAGCRVEIFTDVGNQGRDFLGATVAGSDGGFQLSIDPDAIQAPHLTATQTDARGNTSPFAAAIAAPQPAPPPNLTKKLFLPLVVR